MELRRGDADADHPAYTHKARAGNLDPDPVPGGEHPEWITIPCPATTRDEAVTHGLFPDPRLAFTQADIEFAVPGLLVAACYCFSGMNLNLGWIAQPSPVEKLPISVVENLKEQDLDR